MMQIWRLALNDLRLTARDRPAMLWLLIFPLLMMWFFSGSGGGKGSGPTGLSILDLDGGEVAEQLVAFIETSELELDRVDESAVADERLRLLTIPEGFSGAFAAGRPQELKLEIAADARPDHSLVVRIELTRSIAQLLGTHARAELGRPRTPIELAVTHAGAGRPVPSGAAQSVPGMLTFMVLMMTSIYGAAYLTIEKRSGMLERQALRLTHSRIVLGKILGRLLVGGIQTALLVGGGSLLFGIRWGNSFGAFASLLLAFLICVAAYSTFLGAILRTPAEASAIGWIASMVLAALGGCWWPAEVMPTWIRQLGLLLPTTWAMRGFHSLISFGEGWTAIWPPTVALLLFAVLFSWVGARRLQLTS